MFEPCPADGPVLVAVRYRVAAENLEKLVQAMGECQAITVKDGRPQLAAVSQHRTTRHLSSNGSPFASWSEFELQRTERWLDYDSDGVTRAIGYTVDNARRHQYYLALRVPDESASLSRPLLGRWSAHRLGEMGCAAARRFRCGDMVRVAIAFLIILFP